MKKMSWSKVQPVGISDKFVRKAPVYRFNLLYDFWILTADKNNLQDAINKHFRKINGKVFCPYPEQDPPLLYLALEKEEVAKGQSDDFMMFRATKADDLALITALEEDFDVYRLPKLGDDPEVVMREMKKKRIETYNYNFYQNQYGELRVAEEESSYATLSSDTIFLVGCCKNEDHKDWITKNKKYNVRLGDRRGAVKENDEQVVTVKYLILYDFENPPEYNVYHLDDRQWVYKKEDMVQKGYPDPKGTKYLLYGLKEDSIDLTIDIQRVLISKEVQKGAILEGAPIYMTESELKKYRS